ncbi:MAG TPA: LytTR family DNA-binding domain-containing protein [Chitinophagaceae bacterium]|nr:LytTR family DNA-binding domain-containing protein [Chitinophagaceae bacterium]
MRAYLFFKTIDCYYKVNFADILYIQAEKKCVHVITTTKTLFALNPFKEVEKHLPHSIFFKVHRSFIISLDHTDKFDNEFAYILDKKIPIAEQYRNLLKHAVGIVSDSDASYQLDNGDVDNLLRNLKP